MEAAGPPQGKSKPSATKRRQSYEKLYEKKNLEGLEGRPRGAAIKEMEGMVGV